jgi:hypothetical protein
MRKRSPAKIAASSPPAAARTLEEDIVVVERVGRHQELLQPRFVIGRGALELGDLLLREGAQACVRVRRDCARGGEARARGRRGRASPFRDRVDAREFHGQVAEAVDRPSTAGSASMRSISACRSATRSSRRRMFSFIMVRGPCERAGPPLGERRVAPSAASRSAADGACSSRFVSALASCSRTASGGWPAASCRRASASAASRAASAWPRSSRMAGTRRAPSRRT